MRKKRMDKIEKLKEDVKLESKAPKMLQDLSHEKNDEMVAIDEIEQKLIRSKELINFLKKSIISKRHLHHVLERQLKNI